MKIGEYIHGELFWSSTEMRFASAWFVSDYFDMNGWKGACIVTPYNWDKNITNRVVRAKEQ